MLVADAIIGAWIEARMRATGAVFHGTGVLKAQDDKIFYISFCMV